MHVSDVASASPHNKDVPPPVEERGSEARAEPSPAATTPDNGEKPAPEDEGTPPDPRSTGAVLAEWANKAKELWQIVSGLALSIFGVLAILAIAVPILDEVSGKSIAISDISMPSDLAGRGYSPVVAASRLRDAVEAYVEEVSTVGQFSALSLAQEQPALVLPSLGLPLDVVGDTMARTFHLGGRKRITGEITDGPSGLSLRLRLNDRVIFQGSRRVRRGSDPADSIDALLAAAVPSILEQYAPYIEAAHLLDKEKLPDLAMQKAQAIIDALPDSNDNVPGAYIVFGIVYYQKKEYAAATGALRNAIRLRPNSPLAAVAWRNLGLIDVQQNKFDDAVADEQRSAAAEPGLDPLAELAVIYAEQGKNDQAIAENEAVLRLNPPASTAEGAYLNLGALYNREGKRDRALAAFESAARINPRSAEAHTALGTVLTMIGKLTPAASELRTAVRLDRRDGDAAFNLGVVESAQGKTEQAIADFRDALSLDPRRSAARFGLSNLYDAEGKSALAVEQLVAVLRYDPRNAIALNALGGAYYNEGKKDQAAAEWQKAIRIDPKLPDPYQNLAVYYASIGKPHEAKLSDERAIAADPTFAPAYYDLGLAYDTEKNYDAASRQFRHAILIDPKNSAYHRALGEAYARAHKNDAAITEYQTAASLSPRNAGIYHDLAIIYDREGKHDRAAIESRKAHELNPNLAPRDLSRGHS